MPGDFQFWHRERIICRPPVQHEWWQNRAQTPLVFKQSERRWRIFFTALSHQWHDCIAAIDVDPLDNMRVLTDKPKLIMKPGSVGGFHNLGIAPGSVLRVGARIYLYFCGIKPRASIPHHAQIGLLISDDNGQTFQHYSKEPVIETIGLDPLFVTTPHVCCLNGEFHMWYASGTEIIATNTGQELRYNIRHAVSNDGFSWRRNKQVAIDFKNDREGGVVCPRVIQQSNQFVMWYCYRGRQDYRGNGKYAYRIGYAESSDGIHWQRLDEQVRYTNPAEAPEWDYHMQCYPCVISANNETYMFYCGNEFGYGGFGYARRVAK